MEDIFVGRVECTEKLNAEWNHGQTRIFGIYGAKSVGKTSYVKNFLRILRTSDKNPKVKTLALDFHKIRSYKVYVETVVGYLVKEDCEACSHEHCKCIQKITKSLQDSEDVYIFHHDHQEEAKCKPDFDGKLPDSTTKTLWDQIYTEVVKPLLTDCNNFYLIISSTDEFRFAELRRVFWMQKLPALTESESMELLNDVWPTCKEDDESCQQLVTLCDGVPPAIINAGLLMKDKVITVDEIIQLMVKQIIEVLSDEFLPCPERINTQLQDRWKHLSEEQSDNLVKTLVIIKYTSQSTIAANAKLFKCDNVAEYKFNRLLPLLRRNLLSYNKDNETVSTCPLIQHILEAVNYIKADEIRKDLQDQIKAILEPQMQKGASSCNSCSKSVSLAPYSDDLPSNPCSCPQNSFSGADRANQYAFRNNIFQDPLPETFRARGQPNSSFKTPVENENFENPTDKFCGGIHAQERELNESERTCNLDSRQNSLITQNLDRGSSEKDISYECKDILHVLNTKLPSSSEHMPLENKKAQLVHGKKTNLETFQSFPPENEESNLSTDDKTSLFSGHSESISRSCIESRSGQSQTNSSIDKSNLCPAVTLSGEYETRQTENPDDSSALSFSEDSTPNLHKPHTNQCPNVTLSGVGSISEDKSENRLSSSSSYPSENCQDCSRSDDKGQEVTLSGLGIPSDCVKKCIDNPSPSTGQNTPNFKHDIDQGPFVTVSGVYSAINPGNKTLTLDSRDITSSKSEVTEVILEGQTIPRTVSRSSVQVPEKAECVDCTLEKQGFSYSPGYLHTTAFSNETSIPPKNASSKYPEVSNLRDDLTQTNNVGLIMYKASSSRKTVPRPCVQSALDNQKSNNENPSGKTETSMICQSSHEATGITCQMDTVNPSGLRNRMRNHSKILPENNSNPKDSQSLQSTIFSAQSNANVFNANSETHRGHTASGNNMHLEHDSLSFGESVTSAIGSTGNENLVCEDHDSDSNINSSFFKKVYDVLEIVESLG